MILCFIANHIHLLTEKTSIAWLICYWFTKGLTEDSDLGETRGYPGIRVWLQK